MKIIRTKTYEEMGIHAASIISKLVEKKPDCILGLATGSTPLSTYAELIRRCEEGTLDLSQVTTVNLDEYCGLAPDHPQSYRYFMNQNLFASTNVCLERTFIPNGLAENPQVEASWYERKLSELGGADIQILGLGLNGHIGFNEPDTVFTESTHVVSLSDSTIQANSRFFARKEDVPTQAITMGMAGILKAKTILLLVSGENKAEILTRALTGPVTPEVPASILQQHSDVIVIADEAALKYL